MIILLMAPKYAKMLSIMDARISGFIIVGCTVDHKIFVVKKFSSTPFTDEN